MNAMMTKSTEFPRDTIWAKVITLLKIRFLDRDCISSSATRPATARHNNAMLTTAFLWTCMVQCKHRNTSSLWSNMMLISYTKCLHLPSIPILYDTQDVKWTKRLAESITICNHFSFKSCSMCRVVSCHSCQPSTNNLHYLGDQLIKCGFLLSP